MLLPSQLVDDTLLLASKIRLLGFVVCRKRFLIDASLQPNVCVVLFCCQTFTLLARAAEFVREFVVTVGPAARVEVALEVYERPRGRRFELVLRKC